MLSRRAFTLAATAVAAMTTSPVKAKRANVARCRVSGPIAGGIRGHVFGGAMVDLAAHGYVEEEWFVSGTARSFAPVGELSLDGRWTVRPDRSAAYTTRVVVHRPLDPRRFNGLVMAEWTNVSTFNDLNNAVNECFWQDGYVFIAISAQWVGIHGLDSVAGSGLRNWDPQRYGALVHPGDEFSYDIFTQVARAVTTASARQGPDPLAGLEPRRVIATGESQSAARLASYINAVHPAAKFFDAFIPCVLVGGCSELGGFETISGESAQDYNRRFFARIVPSGIRDDLATPILIMLSETEARMFRVPPPADTRAIRVWEVAGSVHGSACDAGYRPSVAVRDDIKDPLGGSPHRMVRFMPSMSAAGLAIDRWLSGGAPLATHPRLNRGDDQRTILADADGNALGGVRLPEVRVPTATYETKGDPARGVRKPFTAERLAALYSQPGAYWRAVASAVAACLQGDLITPARAAEYLAAAETGPAAA